MLFLALCMSSNYKHLLVSQEAFDLVDKIAKDERRSKHAITELAIELYAKQART
jgi:hypothetical protein